MENISQLKKHFYETKSLVEALSVTDVAQWLLEDGYFPERYVLPPSFQVCEFKLQPEPYNKNIFDLTRRKIEKILYPKSPHTYRQFGIIHPYNYHDIVLYLHNEWERIVQHLFQDDQKIFSYSNPIPVTKRKKGRIGKLRAGRMIYEWLSMAEKDLILDAGYYQFIARTDIANFYASIYTHTIPWALDGRENAYKDINRYELVGSKIDRLLQYANDARTNGIAVGPALNDLIAEILLSRVDIVVSKRIGDSIDFIAARFKDDYRILCQSKEDAKTILQTIGSVLDDYNLVLNERKTTILQLPDGIYRSHDREYFPYSLKGKKKINFKDFEQTLLVALDIHRRYPETSILEKFMSELYNKKKELKINFSKNSFRRLQELKKMIELLFFAKRESQKLLCQVLAVCEQLYITYCNDYPSLKTYLAERIQYEIQVASRNGSTFEVVWFIFFSRFVQLGIKEFDILVTDKAIKENVFYKSILKSQQKFFNDLPIQMFVKPKDCAGLSLAKQIAVFD